MQTVTFTCSRCNNLMAVLVELLGQQVQCPTCGSVVVAPAAAPVPAASSAPADTPFDLALELARQEAHDSIFSDETHDEDLFGSPRPKVEIPTDIVSGSSSAVPLATPPSANGPSQSGFAVCPPGVPHLSDQTEVDLAALQPSAPPLVETPAAPALGPFWSPAGAGHASEPATPALTYPAVQPLHPPSWPAATHFPDVEAQTASSPALPPTIAARRQHSNLLLTILVPYAVLATLVAGYYIWRYHAAPAENKALETIPDVIRLIDNPISPKNKGTVELPSPDSPLANNLKTKLNEPIVVGDLEVTPLRIEQGRLKIFSITKQDQLAGPTITNDALTLHLKIKNRSRNLLIVPTDPMYDRQYNPEFMKAKPYTLIDVNGQKFYGGPIDLYRLDGVRRAYVAGQDNDDKPLGPDEERLTVTCSNPLNDKVLPAVNACRDTMVWRVQLRKGQASYKGRDIPVCTVIGVEFTASDVKKVARN